MTQRTNGNEEDNFDIVKFVVSLNNDTKLKQKSWLIHVPAAAVIHE